MKVLTRVSLAVVTLISGSYLLLLCLLGAPSSWYSVAALLVAGAGMAGLFRLEAISGIALPPLIVASPLILSADVWNKESAGLLVALGVVWISVVISAFLSGKASAVKAMRYSAVSSLVLAIGFGVDRAFTNKLQLHSYEMNWAVGSDDLLGTGPEKFRDQLKVVVYRVDRGSTCYDLIYSSELARYLSSIKKPKVHVEYEVFYDFGRRRGYNVRSIEGMLITKNERPVLNVADSRGGMIGNGSSIGECDR